ncbi:MAG: hypothetical protein IJI66_07600 [Erysipelotrichaceae bacterium]|nr:hypothetical protein [Erysipelotrichaceae bacterium]
MMKTIDKSPIIHILLGIIIIFQGLICIILALGSSPLFALITMSDFLCSALHFRSAKILMKEKSANKINGSDLENKEDEESVQSTKESNVDILFSETDNNNSDTEMYPEFEQSDKIKNAAFVSPDGELLFTESSLNQVSETSKSEDATDIDLTSDFGPRKKTFSKKVAK